jgi:hypothetical protein
LLNALAGAALLAIFGLRWWLDLSPDAPIMKYLVAILFVAALAGPVILLQVEGGEEKDPAPPVADDVDRPTNPE